MEDMAHYCDNVVVMNHAEVVASGTVSEVFSNPQVLADAGLDVPVVAKIAHRLIEMGINLEGELYTVNGVKKAIIDYIGGAK